MNIAELIELLKTKEQDAEVEYVVCKTDGQIVVCDVAKQAQPMIKMLKLFK